jgi:hypothetical protein
MVRIPLPLHDAALLLIPRWAELGLPLQIALLLLACLVPVGLVLYLYRYELRLVARTTAAALLLFRLVVLFLILFLVLLQPVVGRDVTTLLPGRVLVAVDRSDSTDVTDPQRSAVDKLRLAKALHLTTGVPDAQIDEWIAQYEKGGLRWGPDDEDKRRSHDKLLQQVDALTRGEVARRVLAADGVGLVEALRSRHHLDLIGFAQDSWDVRPDQFDQLFRRNPASGGRQPPDEVKNPDAVKNQGADAPRSPAGASAYTDLRLPLEQALKRSGEDQGKVLGVIVLTDGQHNWGQSPVKKALELGQHQLPIYPVALGSRRPPPDVALVDVKAPPAAFKDVDVGVDARFKISGLPAQEVVVELQRPGQAPLEERIRHDGTDRFYNVHFQVRLERAGAQALTVASRPVAGEIRTDNNGRPVVINVADDKARVLLIDGEARWEFHYLQSALLRDRTMDEQSVVFAQPRLGKIPEEELRKLGNPALTLPTDPDAFAPFDCIILGDVTPEQLPPAERVRLEKYVADRGGTLVLLAGKRAMPLAFAGAARGVGPDEDPLLRMLPVEQPRAVARQDGFHVALTEEGKLTPFLQMDPAPDQNLTRWAEFPPHYWGVVGRPKPGATALATVAELAAGKERKAGDDREKDEALIVRQHYGFGRVLFVGLDSTWRWRYKTGDEYHHRFWGQAIRWAASDKPLVAGNEYLRFGTPEPVVKQGQEVEINVRLAEQTGPLGPNALAGARVLRQGAGEAGEQAVALVPLKPREAQPRVLEGKVRDLLPGRYEIELAIPELADKLNAPPGPDGKPGKLRAAFTVAAPEGEEMVELATNWPLLDELAAKSGGKVYTPETAADLADLLARQSSTHVEHSELRLWQTWGTLAAFLVLLTLEWVARKLAGLP